MTKRIAISLDPEQIRLLDSIKGYGKKEAEKVKNILMAYLSEKGYLQEYNRMSEFSSHFVSSKIQKSTLKKILNAQNHPLHPQPDLNTTKRGGSLE